MKTTFALFLLCLSGSGGFLLSSFLDISIFQITVCHEERLIDEENLISASYKKEMNLDLANKHHHQSVSVFQIGSHLMHGDRLFCNEKTHY